MVAKSHSREGTKDFKYLSFDDISTSLDRLIPERIAVSDIPEDESGEYLLVKLPKSQDVDDFKVALMSAYHALSSIRKPLAAGRPNSETGLLNPAGLVLTELRESRDNFTSRNEVRLEKLKEKILSEADWLTAAELSQRAGATSKNLSAAPNRWKKAAKIFALPIQGKDLFPEYVLDVGGQPLKVVKDIINLFGEAKTPWALAIWFGTPNSWLDREKPKDILRTAPSKVLAAAEKEKSGGLHG